MNRSLNVFSRAIVVGVCSVVFSTTISAQVTSIKLPKADTSASFRVLDSAGVVKMKINGDGGFVVGGGTVYGKIPASGAGTRLMWYPANAAFRAGNVNGTQWDSSNIGYLSAALGGNNTASGTASTALGSSNFATGTYSTGIGAMNRASGSYSTAIGIGTNAIGHSSVAIGNITYAIGKSSLATGYVDSASGDYSTAIGYSNQASGSYSTAMGNEVSTDSMTGSFIIGDFSATTKTHSTDSNQMTMRFARGYRLLTNSAATIGVSLAAGGNAWATISDSTKKTNFKKADGDYFLSSLSKLKLGSWNYKAQNADAKNYRHYGPMAQEIYRYFGNDGHGTIGNDTTLSSADMDGIMMICLQALEKRTGELVKANEKISVLEKQNMEMQKQNSERDKTIAMLAERIEKLSLAIPKQSTHNGKQLSCNLSKEETR